MKKLIIIILFLPMISSAQDSARFIRKGLFIGKGTLAIGKPTSFSGTNMYVSGNLEYYSEDNVSFRGGLYVFLGASRPNSPTVLAQNSTVFFGYNYHFKTKNHFDPYLGFEPGLSLTQLKEPDSPANATYPYNVSKYLMSLSPVASATLGINYFASKYTHLFIEATYVNGVHVSDIPAVSLSELRIAFGFGFNIFVLKKK